MNNEKIIRESDILNYKTYQKIQKEIEYLKKSIMPLYDLDTYNLYNLKVSEWTESYNYIADVMKTFPISELSTITNNYSLATQAIEIQNSMDEMLKSMMQLYNVKSLKDISNSIQVFDQVIKNYKLLYYPINEEVSENVEDEKVNNKIVTEIFNSDKEQNIDKEKSAVIILSPINDRVLKYLSENPQELYQLTANNFECVMAEIYKKLGYKVELTKATHDGGKDIIIRKPEILGDFIYYVECKKYAAKRPIGVGIMRNLIATVEMDKVNGGILATTSYFARPAKDLILNNSLNYQIKMHDFNTIKKLLEQVV